MSVFWTAVLWFLAGYAVSWARYCWPRFKRMRYRQKQQVERWRDRLIARNAAEMYREQRARMEALIYGKTGRSVDLSPMRIIRIVSVQ